MRTVLPSVLVALTLSLSFAHADPPRPVPSRLTPTRPTPGSRLPLWVPSAEIGAGLGGLVAGVLLTKLGYTLNVPELVYWGIGVGATGAIFGGVGIRQLSSVRLPIDRAPRWRARTWLRSAWRSCGSR